MVLSFPVGFYNPVSSGATDPYAANVVLFLKGDLSGLSTNTTTTANFTVPAVNSTVTIDVVNSGTLAALRAIRIGDGAGNYIITAIPTSTQLTIRNCGGSDNAVAGTVISAGATIALSMIDSSPTPKILNALGNVQLTSNGIYFDGTDDRLTVSSSEFVLSTSDCTIEFIFKSDNVSSDQRGFFQLSPVSGGLSTSYSNSILIFQGSGDGISNLSGGITSILNVNKVGSGSSVINTTNTYHTAISINSGIARFFLNGNLLNSANISYDFTASNLVVGGYYDQSYLYAGLLKRFRITKGIGRYIANFNPETDTYLNF